MAPKKGGKAPPRVQYFNAIRDQKLDTLRWCLRHGGVTTRTEDEDGHTGLQIAAAAGLSEALDTILDSILKVGTKDEVEEADDEGRTPLMMAAHNGKLACVKLLVVKGRAPLGTKCEKGKTAAEYAAARKHDKVAAFLRDPKGHAESSDESEEEGEAERQTARVFKASQKLASAVNEQEEVHRKKVQAAEALQAALAEAPEPVWGEVKAVLSETRRELSLRGKEPLPGVSTVDPALWNCVCLQELRLEMAAGALTSLPPRLGQLSQLTTLIVSNNALTALPDVFASLPRLRNLEAAKNELRELPPSLSSLSQLQVVDVSHNQISSAAPLAPLVGLVAVQLGDNALESLPEWRYEEMEHLSTLAAPANRISRLPPGIGSLPMLAALDLSGNQVRQVPIELGSLSPKKLQTVRLAGNPLADPRIRRFVETDAPTLVKDLLNHVAKNGHKEEAAAAAGGKKGKKGKGKAAAPPPSDDDDDEPEGSVADLLAALNASSGSESEGEAPAPAPAPAPSGGKKKKKK